MLRHTLTQARQHDAFALIALLLPALASAREARCIHAEPFTDASIESVILNVRTGLRRLLSTVKEKKKSACADVHTDANPLDFLQVVG